VTCKTTQDHLSIPYLRVSGGSFWQFNWFYGLHLAILINLGGVFSIKKVPYTGSGGVKQPFSNPQGVFQITLIDPRGFICLN
jgi:hypothetical protein